MGDACRFFNTPITGGNVSLYNETLGEGVFPTPVVGIVGLLPSNAPVPLAFQHAGRAVLLLGGLGDCDPLRFGGTEYAKVIVKGLWGLPPALDLDYEKRIQGAIREVVRAGLAESSHDLSDGGLAVALAESAQAGVGARIEVESDLRPEFLVAGAGFHCKPIRGTGDRPASRRRRVGAWIHGCGPARNLQPWQETGFMDGCRTTAGVRGGART
jgi:phosphoribosylformylglycinamidine synthase